MLRLENVSRSFGGVQAIRDVTLDFAPGSLSAVIGPNGAGKTTLFNLITGHFRPNQGRILLEGEDLVGLSTRQIVRKGVGRAFQVASVFPSLTVEEAMVAAVVSHMRGAYSMLHSFPPAAARTKAFEHMELLGLARSARRPTRDLSHGDQKLLDIGLALALEPRVLMLDEPTAGMGPEERWQMIGKVRELWREKGMTLVFIEHDMDIVFEIAQTIRVLRYGAVLAEGDAAAIRGNPEVIEAYLGEVVDEEELP